MKNVVFLTHENIDTTAVAKAMFYDVAVALKEHLGKITFISAGESEHPNKADVNGIYRAYFNREHQGIISLKDIFSLLNKLFSFANLAKKSDVLVFRSYPMIIMMYFFLITTLRNKKVVFDSRGLFFEELFDSGKLKGNRFVRSIFIYIERKILSVSDVVICVSEAQRDVYEKLTKNTDYKVIYNATPLTKTSPKDLNDINYTIGYVGSLVSWHMPERTCSILKELKSLGVNFTFHCITRDVKKAEKIFGELGNAKVYTHDYRQEPIKFDLGICLIQGGISKEVCFPVKFAEYVAADTDVIFSDNMLVCKLLHSKFEIGFPVTLGESDRIIAEKISKRLKADIPAITMPNVLDFSQSIEQYKNIISY